jgi:hypothetical protein
VLYLEPGSDVAAEEVARAVSVELGRPVRLGEAGSASPGDVLIVRSQNGVIQERYADARGRHIERELTAPQDGSARVRTIALLAGNLARNEADEILAPKSAPPPTPGASEIVVRVAPGDRVRTTVETNGSTTRSPPSTDAVVAPQPAPTAPILEVEETVHEVGSKQRTWGWITFASGAGLAAAGGVYAAVAGGQAPACAEPVSPGGATGPAACTVDGSRQGVIIVDALLGAGAVLAATGLVLVLSSPRERSGPTLAIGAGPGTLRLGGTF